MTEAIRVEAPDRGAAASLAEHLLGAFDARAGEDAGRHFVEIARDRPFDRLVADIVPAVQGWLAATGRESAHVVVDGRIYTVVNPG